MKRKILYYFVVFIFLLFFGCSFAQNINQKPIFELNSLSFEGNNFFSDDFLRKLISTKETPSSFSKFLYKLNLGLGSPPSYYNPQEIILDIPRIIKFYQENGFTFITVDTIVMYDNKSGDVDLIIKINEGYRSKIDTVIFLKIDSLEENIKNNIILNSRIKQESGFNSEALISEIKRIIQLLYNSGYPDAFIDNKAVRIEKYLSTNNFRIVIPIETGLKAYFGEAKIKWEGAQNQNIQEEIIFKQLDFKTGEPYSIEKKIESERNLSHLGIFDYARIESPALKANDTTKYRNLSIVLRPKDRYELAPEIFVNNEDYSFNLGIGLSGIVRNIGGGAQSIVGRASLRAQSFNQGSMDYSLQWIQPYLFSNKFSLNISTSFEMDYRDEYKQNILKSKVGVTSKFHRYNFFNYGFFDWELERAELDTQNVTNLVAKEELSILEEPQFNSIFRITLQHDNTNDIFAPSSGEYLSVSIEEAGLIPSLLIKERNKLRYAQYYKLTFFGKYFKSIDPDSSAIFASKLKFGFAKQYGSGQDEYPIPLTRRFFAGGSGSVRGWSSRALGTFQRPEIGGKIILEMNLEARIQMVKQKADLLFLDANKIWLVFFLDFGNIWNNFNDMHLYDLALAGGIGLRYNAFFGPIRFDFGFKIYDPAAVDSKWIFGKKFFPDVISKGQIHFGIGHSF